MIRTRALFAVLISGALIDVARGSDLVECEPQRVIDDGRHWAYRIIDGRECWYPGRPGKPKNELYWGRGTVPSARQTVDQPEAETGTCPPSRPRASWLRHRRNRRSPRQCRRNGAPPAAGRSWRSPPSRRLGRWPCYRSGSTRCGGLPSQHEDYGLFVPGMLAE